jgi:hypothetical protein
VSAKLRYFILLSKSKSKFSVNYSIFLCFQPKKR